MEGSGPMFFLPTKGRPIFTFFSGVFFGGTLSVFVSFSAGQMVY